MSDEFKKRTFTHIDIAGVKCPCCNRFHGKSKSKLNRLARAKLKQDDIKGKFQ